MITNYLIKNISEVRTEDLNEMYVLMISHYNNVCKDKFTKDFLSKDGVIILYDAFQKIKGFSTYRIFITEVQNERIKIIFSGDTIIDVSCWGKSSLFEGFIELMVKTYLEVDLKLYWLLITKGFRTYQILPIYFKEFYPCVNRVTPEREAILIDTISEKLFGKDWCEKEKVIRFNPPADYLKSEYAIVDEHKMRSEHVRFFLEKNPGYAKGDEMPCITQIEPSNFSKLTFKFAKKYGV